MNLKVGDIVYNEYKHTGRLIEINYPNEAKVQVFDYGIENDIDFCSLKECRLATDIEISNSFNKKI